MSLPSYPAYKSVDADWIGTVPAHWQVKALKFLANAFPSNVDKKTKDGEITVQLCNYTDVYYSEEIIRSPQLMQATATEDQIARFTLRADDTIITKDSESWDDIAVAAYVPETLEGIVCGYHLSVIRPKRDAYGKYLKRVFDSECARKWLGIRANGLTRVGLAQSALGSLPVPLPPLNEQHAIADFLDRETAKIDALIEEQEKLISLLQEKRQAVISHAVTKGLDPDAPMKPSGIEWLGDIPAHWETKRIGRLFREIREAGDDSLPILSVSIHHGVSDGELDPDALDRKVTRSEDRTKYRRVEPNDLVYNMMRAWQGGFGTVEVAGAVSPAYVIARPTEPIPTKFVEHTLRTPMAVEEMRRHSAGVTDFRLRLYWDRFKTISVPQPPVDDQEEILRFVDYETNRIDQLADVSEQNIKLLKERRAALISAAVTGKIDVRELAGQSANYAEEAAA